MRVYPVCVCLSVRVGARVFLYLCVCVHACVYTFPVGWTDEYMLGALCGLHVHDRAC